MKRRDVYAGQLKEALEGFSNRECFHIKRRGEYRTWTYTDFSRDLNSLTSILEDIGIENENCILTGKNSPEWVTAYHSIFLAGGITVPVDSSLPVENITDIVEQTNPVLVFCPPDFIPLFDEISRSVDSIKRLFILDYEEGEKGEEKKEESDAAPERHKRFRDLVSSGDESRDAFQRNFQPEDTISILFTSGTTGSPKGAVLTQKNYSVIGPEALPIIGISKDDTALALLPLYHVFGFAACISAPLLAGADIVFIPDIKPPLIIEGINEKEVSYLPSVPKVLSLFSNSIERNVKNRGKIPELVFSLLKRLSAMCGKRAGRLIRPKLFSSIHKRFGGNLKYIISGGAPLSDRVYRNFQLFGFEIMEGYGLTETFGPVSVCPFNDQRRGSVGPPLNRNRFMIRNPDLEGTGDVLIKGDCVFKEYYKDPEATSEVFDKEGWFHSGDTGYLDKDNFLYIRGRTKDIIVLDSGKNVYPLELEMYYGKSPLIAEIGVFGTDVRGSTVTSAVIVPSEELKEESVADVEEAINNEMARLNKHRPAYKRIIDYAISYEPLPRTTTKKIKKHILKEEYYDYKTGKFHFHKTSGSRSVKDSNEFQVITESIEELLKANKIKGVDQIEPSSRFHIDLGIDLMLLFELIEIIERKTDKGIPAEKLDTIESVGDLYLVLKEKGSASLKSESLLTRIAAVKCITLSYTPEASKAKRLITDISDNIYRTIMTPDVSGLENISDRPGMIMLFNDNIPGVWFRIASALPDRIRKETVTLSKKEGRNMLIQSSGLKFANLPDTAYPGISILKQGFAALNSGYNLLIPLKQERLFKETVFILNQTLNPVIPVITKRSFNSPSDFFRKKSRISVDFGKAVTSRDILRDRNISPYADTEITFDTISEWIRETFFSS